MQNSQKFHFSKKKVAREKMQLKGQFAQCLDYCGMPSVLYAYVYIIIFWW
jgi:hypothetical protein